MQAMLCMKLQSSVLCPPSCAGHHRSPFYRLAAGVNYTQARSWCRPCVSLLQSLVPCNSPMLAVPASPSLTPATGVRGERVRPGAGRRTWCTGNERVLDAAGR